MHATGTCSSSSGPELGSPDGFSAFELVQLDRCDSTQCGHGSGCAYADDGWANQKSRRIQVAGTGDDDAPSRSMMGLVGAVAVAEALWIPGPICVVAEVGRGDGGAIGEGGERRG